VYESIALSRLIGHVADVVAAVRAGRSLADVMPELPDAARPGTQALAFDVLRRLGGAMRVRAMLAPRDPPARVDALLTSALALLWPADDPPYADHTLVDQAVTCARERAPAAAPFVNAVLRRFIREREARVREASQDPVGAWNHPAWWVERVRQDWPGCWQAQLQAANRHPPMTLRVNARRLPAADYLARLRREGLDGRVLDDPVFGGQALQLARPVPVQRLPGFAEGDVSVQDAHAQCAGPLLLGGTGAASLPLLPEGARVLDACAAPGGKTAQLLERATLDLLALDSDPRRLARVDEGLRRLGLRAATRVGDATRPAGWWDGRPFDAILVDAPCSGSGVGRRHPDIRWLRRPEDIQSLTRIQASMLDALWPLLKPGGRLVYATCSIFRAEGQAQVDAFVQRHRGEGVRVDPASPGHLLPLADNSAISAGGGSSVDADGFFYALLLKPH
jgi:16S rRNA (cytosine967-C5)-methyltransferase